MIYLELPDLHAECRIESTPRRLATVRRMNEHK
jgi:hypothetical protein